MRKTFNIRKPFFEFGPKIYLYGDEITELALHGDFLAEKYDVDIIFTLQYTDIERIARRTKNIKVFAQNMDPAPLGPGMGKVTAEALTFAKAEGVMLNHAEAPLSLQSLNSAIKRSREVGLATIVCAGTIEESAAVACLKPDILLAESPTLIGTGKRSQKDKEEIIKINEAISKIDPSLPILHAAGISDAEDVYEIILAGADGSGSTSGIIKARDQKEMFSQMIEALREAYDTRTRSL